VEVELVIPAKKSKSVEDGQAARVVLKPQMSEGVEREVKFVPVPAAFRAKPGRVIDGFDPILDPEDEAPWASVTGGKIADHVEFFASGAVQSGVGFEVVEGQAAVSIQPALASADVTPLTLTGGAVAGPTQAVVVAKIAGREIARLKIWVLPQRELEFSIFRIIDASAPADTKPPANAPADAEVTATLNEVFKQAGIKWTLVPGSNITVHYDKPIGLGDKMLSVSERSNLLLSLQTLVPEGEWESGFKAVIVKNFAPGTPAITFHLGTGNLAPGGLVASNYSIPKLAIAHEFGHALELPVKDGPDRSHDSGPWPSGVESLMRPGPGTTGQPNDPGKWLRQEDWERANTNAAPR